MSSSQITVKRLQEFIAAEVRYHFNAAFLANGLAVKAMLAVLDVFENRLLLLLVPAYHIDKTCFIAQLATDAVFRLITDLMLCINHDIIPFLESIPLFGVNSGQQRRQVMEFLDIMQAQRFAGDVRQVYVVG